ncbi:MAG: metal ABC transporter permease [Alistipes sp.]|nr:metal ABC transporter permease [Alistipes sp.]
MDFFYDIAEYEFLQNAVLVALFAGITCGIIGTYIVSRRLVFLCGGITHSSFGGLGIAFYVGGINPIWGAMGFAIASALGIEWASARKKIREDSAIGIIWSVGMAIGALFMSLTPGYTSGELAGYLFGNILTATTEDVMALGVFTALVVIGALIWWRPIMYLAFDRSFAATQGVSTKWLSYLMSTITAIAIVLCIRVMGIVLLLSLFTLPVVIANIFTKSYGAITIWAAIITTLASLAGLIVSYNWDIPTGVSIIFMLCIVLIAVKILSLRSKKVF